MKQFDVVVVGGGAAGFFTAINLAEKRPDLSVAILERGSSGLQKVKVSGGGRCNVTHAEFIPQPLTENYPRGRKELLGPFHTFMTGDTIAWFENRGIELKIEDDGRMFPITDSSQTIINCFLDEVKRLKIDLLYNHGLKSLEKRDGFWQLHTSNGLVQAEAVVMATGSSTKIWDVLKGMGHQIVKPVPSLFTFNVKDQRIKDIPGVVVPHVQVKVVDLDLESEGPLLITHVGLSAPSILKLSAFGAIALAETGYKFKIEINFIGYDFDSASRLLFAAKHEFAKTLMVKRPQFEIPKRLWKKLVEAAGIGPELRWADANKEHIESLACQLTKAVFQVGGKSTFKEEFVTAGGVELKEINFKTFESKLLPNLYFAGEIMNIDAVTGGFNFQNAWTSGFLVSQSISEKIKK